MVVPENGGAGLPCGYSMLPDKKKSTYELLFKTIKNKVGDISKLTTIISDFEISVYSAVNTVFPGVVHKGCRYHHNAAVWRKLGDEGLHTLFYQSPSFQEVVYMLYALAYVPEDQVKPFYYDYIVPQIGELSEKDEDWSDYEEELNSFGNYYLTTWIERRNRPALFNPELWNHYTTILNDGTQTNNMLESFNRTWNSLAGSKPNVWGILELFVSQEADTRRKFLSNSVGQDMRTNTGKKQRSMNSRDRLKFLVQAFDTIPRPEYLQQIAHELQRADT